MVEEREDEEFDYEDNKDKSNEFVMKDDEKKDNDYYLYLSKDDTKKVG